MQHVEALAEVVEKRRLVPGDRHWASGRGLADPADQPVDPSARHPIARRSVRHALDDHRTGMRTADLAGGLERVDLSDVVRDAEIAHAREPAVDVERVAPDGL